MLDALVFICIGFVCLFGCGIGCCYGCVKLVQMGLSRVQILMNTTDDGGSEFVGAGVATVPDDLLTTTEIPSDVPSTVIVMETSTEINRRVFSDQDIADMNDHELRQRFLDGIVSGGNDLDNGEEDDNQGHESSEVVMDTTTADVHEEDRDVASPDSGVNEPLIPYFFNDEEY